MPIAMTERQRQELDELGYTVLESFLTGDALDSTVASMDRLRDTEARNSRGCCALDETFRDLMDNDRVLELVVDAIGWNIQMRDCIFVCTEPSAVPPPLDTLGFPWHFDQVGLFAGLTHDGVMPLVDLKVSWYLSDHLEEGHGCTLGSHRWTPAQRASWEQHADLATNAVPVRVPRGSIMLWRSSMLHAVAPHCSPTNFRYHVHISYTPRWIRPTGYFSHDETLLERSSPVRRQLLGAQGDNSSPTVNGGTQGLVASHYWFPSDFSKVPLKEWAEARLPSNGPAAWGIMPLSGASWPNTLPKELETTQWSWEEAKAFLKTVLHPGSPEYQKLDEGAGYRQSYNNTMLAEWFRQGAVQEQRSPVVWEADGEANNLSFEALLAENRRLTAENAALRAKL